MGKKKGASEELPAPPAVDNKCAEEPEDTPVVTALKTIDDKYCALELQFEQEVESLRKKYSEKQSPLLEERVKVLMDASSCPAEDKEFGTPACKGFWLQAMQNADDFAEALEEWDDPVLEYLQNIKKTNVTEQFPQKGFKLEFVFSENPYLVNSTLWVQFHTNFEVESYKPYLEPECIEVKSSGIKWKDGKDVTVKFKTAPKAKKKSKSKGMDKSQEPRESFFRFLFRNLKLGDPAPEDLAAIMMGDAYVETDDDDNLTSMILEQLHGIGQSIASEIIPYAVRYYTGEAGGDNDDDDDEDPEEEDSNDFDDDDEDSDDEPPPTKGTKKKGQKAPTANKAEVGPGAKTEECKQQ